MGVKLKKKKLSKRVFGLAILFAGLACVYFGIPHSKTIQSETELERFIEAASAIGTDEDPLKRFNYEIKLQADPRTGDIPPNIYSKEKEFIKSIPTAEQFNRDHGNARQLQEDWQLAGPFNVGGRTRALALDTRNEDIIIAGGVSGGMWRSVDAGDSWAKASHPTQINSSTCVAQDTRTGKEDVWYHGTGELRGGSAREVGAPHRGDGIFKSLDGGETWAVLPSTADGKVNVFNSPFNYVWNIVVNHTRTDVDEIYAAVYGGIVRSQDGGSTWTTVLGENLLGVPDDFDLNDLDAPFYTNVIITPSGTLYATLSTFVGDKHVTGNRGVFRSTDGVTWQNISPSSLTLTYSRMVLDYAPSNEDVLYMMVDAEGQELWKYNDGLWFNRSANLPDFPERLGQYDSQDSYNMMIEVHPLDENMVYLGGTNLFRSSDGFSTSANTDWIGGYDQEEDNGSSYEGHHPDQHDLVFYPSNPDKAISANDGGIMVSSNITASTVSWFSMNNGYVTTQFYSVAVSKDNLSNQIIGGMQDNGSYARSTPGENVPWNRILGGDGGYAATTPGDLFWYVSFQEGRTFRLTLQEQFQLTSFARVDPQGVEDQLFITPYILDPNNYNRMYYAGGDVIYRNDNLSQVPSGSQDPTSVNWERLGLTSVGQTDVSALDVSTNISGRLYFGIETGTVFRVDGADTGQPERSTVFTSNGYVVNIAIDPSDADNVLMVYSNYNVPSLFFTGNGGTSVQDVSGNLEEFEDGTGNGPSTRWAEIIPLNDGSYKYFVGTSTGLYSTTTLNGTNTMWVKEASELIGDAVVRMLDYRDSDGKMVVGTHGNGVFETNISNTLQVPRVFQSSTNFELTNVFPNPFKDEVDIEFVIPEQGNVRVDILNTAGQVVDRLLDFTQFAGKVQVAWDGTNPTGIQVRDGIYFYRIEYGNTVKTGKLLYDK